VQIAAGLPIRELTCTSHKTKAAWSGPSIAKVTLDPSETRGGNRDYVLKYRLDGDRVQSGMLLFEGKKENFFLLMMQPPKRITKEEIPGREYIFIVDVSGSMYGFPLEISKKLMSDLLGNLRPTDRFNVLLFSGGSSVLAEESLPATGENIARAVQLIERQKGGGGTELLPALKRALSLKKAENFSRTVVIATDGYVTVEEEVFDLIRNNLGNANLFAFGIGTSVNRHIIEGMARVGMGEPFVIARADEAPARAASFRRMILSPVLTQVKVEFKGFDAYDVEPLAIPDVLADRPVIVFGKWRGKAKGSIAVSGNGGEGRYRETIEVANVKPSKANLALRYLWARHRITLLSDYNKLRPSDKRTREMTELGLRYNLLTATTSFVAIDSEVRNADGTPAMVKQPLPLPEGVSDYAVGRAMMQTHAPMAAMAKKADLPSENKIAVKDKRAKEEDKDRKTAVIIEDVAVSQGLSKEDVRKKLEEHAATPGACLTDTSGKLVLKLTVKADGTVKRVQVLSNSFKDGRTSRCLADRLKTLRLPATLDGKEGRIIVTLSA
jgi:Ca-activated chloride channel family protein